MPDQYGRLRYLRNSASAVSKEPMMRPEILGFKASWRFFRGVDARVSRLSRAWPSWVSITTVSPRMTRRRVRNKFFRKAVGVILDRLRETVVRDREGEVFIMYIF